MPHVPFREELEVRPAAGGVQSERGDSKVWVGPAERIGLDFTDLLRESVLKKSDARMMS